jgi:hypothetical protein
LGAAQSGRLLRLSGRGRALRLRQRQRGSTACNFRAHAELLQGQRVEFAGGREPMRVLVVLHRLDRRSIPFAVRLRFVNALGCKRRLNFGDSRRCWRGLRFLARFALSRRALNNRFLRCCGFSCRAGRRGLRRRKAQPNETKRRQEYCGEPNLRDCVCAHFYEFARV